MKRIKMYFIIILLILLNENVLCEEGIFDPYTYTENSCTGIYQWTGWFDTNDPTLVQPDLEITQHIQQIFPTFMCSSPIAIQAQTSMETSPATTHDVFRISVNDGFLCLNQYVTGYKNQICADYKVRYCCPINNA